MKLTIQKKDLLGALARCSGIANSKSTMPILANVLLSAQDGKLTVSATDLYVAVSGSISADVDEPGAIALPARDLLDRIKAMPDGKVSLSTDGNVTTMKASGAARRYKMHGLPGDEFPALPEPGKKPQKMTLTAATLAKLIASTAFSISPDETRLHLSSALLELDGKSARMVSTDGHRLSLCQLPELQLDGSEDFSPALIPLKGITELRKLCDGVAADSVVGIAQSGPNAFFTMGDFCFSVKLVDAQFPPYQQVIPASNDKRAVVPRLAFIDALKAVQVSAADRTGGVRFDLGKGSLKLSAETPDAGEGTDEVKVEYSGAPLGFGLNAKYALDVLRAIESESVALELSGELDPCVVTPAEQIAGGKYLAVIMPLRV